MATNKKPRRRVEIGYDGSPSTDTTQGSADVTADNGILPSKALPYLKTPDNAALALAMIPHGTPLRVDGRVVSKAGCEYDIPEGHRFACTDIKKGDPLTSWGITFGVALEDIPRGSYLSNTKTIANFRDRKSDLHMPTAPNFENVKFKRFDLTSHQPSQDATEDPSFPEGDNKTFMGFPRPGNRGVGTRNYVVLLGVTSQSSSFVRGLQKNLRKGFKRENDNYDGIVAVAHTEGGLNHGTADPNNFKKVLRVLSGFIVHPNVSGILIVDKGTEKLQTEELLQYMRDNNYPLDSVPHRTMRLSGHWDEDMKAGEQHARDLEEIAKTQEREPSDMANVVFALQCGGSDAFSGISANPLVGWVARRLISYGGSAILAETDELIGAEEYVLKKVRNVETAEKFLQLIDRYYRYTGRFGHSPEGNPSGGNLFRGLYNITLKSAGAAMKKLPSVRLEHVVEYGERLNGRTGYCFMDSPGNDLESIAGQVACGCNAITFTTGNGAITNFPFVPTVKVLTTSKRFQLLSNDMDINAGKFLDGTLNLEELGHEVFSFLVDVVSGRRTTGELAGHHQVQIWRNWEKSEGDEEDALEETTTSTEPFEPKESKMELDTLAMEAETKEGQHHELNRHATGIEINSEHDFDVLEETGVQLSMIPINKRQQTATLSRDAAGVPITHVSEHIGMVLPTSLCSSAVADMLCQKLQEQLYPEGEPRIVTLPHTEGCGQSSGETEAMYVRCIVGYARHPMVGYGVFLEHGCEKTHNDRFHNELTKAGYNPQIFGYASIQLDGGITNVTQKLSQCFAANPIEKPMREVAPFSQLRLGLVSTVKVPSSVLRAMGILASSICHHGGTVVAAGTIRGGQFLHKLLEDAADGQDPSLAYGQVPSTPGFHIMDCATNHFVETVSGLGATGVEVVVSFVPPQGGQGHPLVPMLQCSCGHAVGSDIDIDLQHPSADFDSDDDATERKWAVLMATKILDVCSRRATPKMFGSHNVDFQITRGRSGVSL